MFYSRILQCRVQTLEQAEMIQIGIQYLFRIKKTVIIPILWYLKINFISLSITFIHIYFFTTFFALQESISDSIICIFARDVLFANESTL